MMKWTMWKRSALIMVTALAPMAASAGGAPAYSSEHFRWRNDDGDAGVATWKADADTAVSNVLHYQNIRLRFSIGCSLGEDVGVAWGLKYATAMEGPWTEVVETSNGTYAFEMAESPWYTNAAPPLNLLGGTGTYAGGAMVEYPRAVSSYMKISASQYGNYEYCLRPTAKARGGVTYYFRPTDVFDPDCSQYAQLTMEPYDPPEAPRIVSPLAATVNVDMGETHPAQDYVILASGSEPIAYEAIGVPPGFALMGNVISDNGTSSTPGTYSVTLTARNAYGSDTRTLSLTVPDYQPPAFRVVVSGEAGQPFRYTMWTAGTGPISNSISVLGGGALPPGLVFDGTNTIHGVPQEAGITKITVTARHLTQAATMALVLTIVDGTDASADGDADGMPDSWEIQHFGATDVPGGAADADADGDGMTNVDEYAAGTDPTNAASVLRIQGVEQQGDGLIVRWQSVAGREYEIRKASDVRTGFGDVEAAGLSATPPLNTYTVNMGQAVSGYYRVEAEKK